MMLLTAIVALLAIQLLYLVCSLPREITNPDAGVGNEPRPTDHRQVGFGERTE
jgi:hypothetical protein